MKAGASSMWASCCGLLNEVIGTGTVRAQQPGFGGGAGPFRFAPSGGYSTYPPPAPTAATGSTGQLCKACGLAFSVFRRKHVCCDCRKSFCALCSVLQGELWRCSTCQLLRATCFQRPRLMQLRVRDLRQYLLLRNIPTDTCREKEDLVDLVLCHRGAADPPGPLAEEQEVGEEVEEEEEEEDDGEAAEDTDSLPSLPPSLHASPPGGATRSPSPLSPLSPLSPPMSPLSATQGDALSHSSGSQQEHDDTPTISLLTLEPAENIIEVSPASQRRIRASLSDLDNEAAIEHLSVRQLKEILARNFVSYSGCCEKWELLERVHRLYRENEQNRKSMENVSNTITAVVAYPPPNCNSGVTERVRSQLASDDNLCRICMDAVIDCVLLECGHMVTCTKCGKRMSECPICRQYVVRAVHVFKS